jgi:hypothetical protein
MIDERSRCRACDFSLTQFFAWTFHFGVQNLAVSGIIGIDCQQRLNRNVAAAGCSMGRGGVIPIWSDAPAEPSWDAVARAPTKFTGKTSKNG